MQNSKLSSKQKKILTLSILGTCLEFYDFTLFSVFAVQIGRTFFTSQDPLVSTISALGAFAAGFLMRPLGALVIGFIGDRYSRNKALSLSIILMGFPALVVSVLPSYASIGIAAPILILFFRLIQGFSAGGEFNGAAIYILENLPGERKAFYSSLIATSGGLGAILAFLIGAFLSLDFMPDYAFRFAFLFGASVSVVGFVLRRRTADESQEVKPKGEEQLSILSKVFKHHKNSFITTFSIGALDGALSYSVAGFISIYISQFIGLNLSFSMAISALSLVFYIIATPLIAKIYDKLNAKRFFLLFFISFVFCVPLAFTLIQTESIPMIILGQLLVALMLSCFSGTQHAFMQNLFPKEVRYTGVAFGYNLGTCLLGGSSPMVLTWLLTKTNDLYIPVYYLISLSCFTGFMIFKTLLKNRSNA